MAACALLHPGLALVPVFAWPCGVDSLSASKAVYGVALPGSASTCWEEWAILKRAFTNLIMPHVDEERLRDAIANVHFNWSR